MNGRRDSRPTRTTRTLGALAGLALSLGGGCVEGVIGEPGASCESSRTYFLTEVWGKVMAQRCVGCHSPGGTAQLRGARFQLLPASYPDFADANLASTIAMVNQSYNVNGQQMSAILAKPLGLVQHGGGSVLQMGSAEQQALQGFVDRMGATADQADDACRDYGSLAAPSGVVLLDWHATLRKAALDQAGRLPTDAEYARATTEEGFMTVLAAMLEEPTFYRRWRTAWNDVMLTDRYVTNDGCDQRALNLINNSDFPNRGAYAGGATGGLDCCGMDRANPMCADVRDFFRRANNAVAQEPINLFEHIVRNNRPFSEIITADYTMMNAQSAFVYGASESAGFTGYDSDELHPGRIRYTRVYARDRMTNRITDSETTDFPHAGVLTTPVFLARYPTTATNRNRHRARIVQSYFLATDILKVGERPIDPTASEALVQTPVLNYGPCVTCHRINDPIAGSFRGFYPDDSAFRYNPRDGWYTDMAPPGFAGEDMPASNYRAGVRWLAPRIATDPRFVSSVIRFVYKTLSGREPLVYPTDTSDPLYAQHAAAWNEQDRVFRAVGRRFTATGMNFKTAVAELIRSPLYRAVGAVGVDTATARAAHGGVGTAMLLTPEMLDRRIEAIMGFRWTREQNRPETQWLTHEFYFPYGGIDSDTIVRRASDASGILVGVSQRMSEEVACRATGFDFTRPQASRRFFRYVRPDTIPEAGGQPVPNNIAMIRQNIAALYDIVLGEQVAVDSPQVDIAYNLFVETWREISTSGMVMPDLCRGIYDPATGAAVPREMQITGDPSGAVRAWQAVMTYLLSDYRFLYQ